MIICWRLQAHLQRCPDSPSTNQTAHSSMHNYHLSEHLKGNDYVHNEHVTDGHEHVTDGHMLMVCCSNCCLEGAVSQHAIVSTDRLPALQATRSRYKTN